MATRTAQRIITRVMRDLNYIGRNATPKADDSTDALDTFNDWLESLNLEHLMLPYTSITDQVLTDGDGMYTIGLSGGSIPIARPEDIDGVSLILNPSNPETEIPLHKVIDFSEWQRITSKDLSSEQPGSYWYNPKTTFGELNIHPVPSGTPTIRLYTQDRLTRVATLATSLTLDDGYMRMIHYNLGVELQPGLGVPLPENWMKLAIDSQALLKSVHIEDHKLELDDVVGVGNHYNIYSDRANRG